MATSISYDYSFLESLYSQKKYEEVIQKITSINDITQELKEKLGYAYFHSHRFEKAYEIFNETNNLYKCGQCQLMLGNLDKAHQIFDNANTNSATNWGKCLVELIQMKLSKPPSFLQIRNFLESDLNMLIECEKYEYAENIIKWNQLLADLNSETYKYIGKVLFFNKYYKLSKTFLDKSKEILPNDPETFYYLAHYYECFEEYEITKSLLNKAIKLNPDYAPAKGMLSKLESINN